MPDRKPTQPQRALSSQDSFASRPASAVSSITRPMMIAANSGIAIHICSLLGRELQDHASRLIADFEQSWYKAIEFLLNAFRPIANAVRPSALLMRCHGLKIPFIDGVSLDDPCHGVNVMPDQKRLRELYRRRNDWREAERAAARLRRSLSVGGLLVRFWMWVEGKARKKRVEIENKMREDSDA